MHINFGFLAHLDVVESFTFCVTMPSSLVQAVVERHFVYTGNMGFAGFNRVHAIKELRELGTPRTNGNLPSLSVHSSQGLRLGDARDMIAEIYREGEEAGNYHATRPPGWVENSYIDPLDIRTSDDLPF